MKEVFEQAVYQFASTHAAARLYGQISAKYRSCRSVSAPDANGGTLHLTVHARYNQRVGVPAPTLSSLTLKLIARVRALR